MLLLTSQNKNVDFVTIVGSIKAGTMYEAQGKSGSAELVSRLLMRGSGSLSGEVVAERIEEMGATLQFSNYDESVNFTAKCQTDHAKNLLTIISDCISNPKFAEEELEKTRKEIIADLEAEKDDTRTTAYRELMGLIFGIDGPYGRNSLGKIEDLRRLTKEDVKEFYERFYSPRGLILSATGSLNHSELLGKVEATLGLWYTKGARIPDALPLRAQKEASILTIPMEHKTQMDLALGARAVRRNSDEYYSLNLGNLMLGRIGLYGRLGKNLRDEKGLAYYCFSVLQSRLLGGSIAIFAGVSPKNAARATEGIFEEIEKVGKEALTDDEIAIAKRNLKGSLSIALETSSERANIIHDIEYFGLGLDYLQRYESILDSVDAGSVLAAFSRYLKPELVSLVSVGPSLPEKIELPHAISKMSGT